LDGIRAPCECEGGFKKRHNNKVHKKALKEKHRSQTGHLYVREIGKRHVQKKGRNGHTRKNQLLVLFNPAGNGGSPKASLDVAKNHQQKWKHRCLGIKRGA